MLLPDACMHWTFAFCVSAAHTLNFCEGSFAQWPILLQAIQSTFESMDVHACVCVHACGQEDLVNIVQGH